jgi:hypothetical protein
VDSLQVDVVVGGELKTLPPVPTPPAPPVECGVSTVTLPPHATNAETMNAGRANVAKKGLCIAPGIVALWARTRPGRSLLVY